MLNTAFVLLALCCIVTGVWASPKATEERLKSRVTAFWEAWVKGDHKKLKSFVRAEDREAFLRIQLYQLSDYKIDTVELAPDKKTAIVNIKIKRTFPFSGNPVDWTLSHPWHFEKGDWYFQMTRMGAFEAVHNDKSNSNAGKTVPPPSDIVFEKTEFDFGTVTMGKQLTHSYSFENRGSRSVRVIALEVPCFAHPERDLCVGARVDPIEIPAGGKGFVEAKLERASSPRKVDESFQVTFDNGERVTLRFMGNITATDQVLVRVRDRHEW